MILADTSVWVEFLRGNPRYSNIFRDHLDQQRIAAIECVFGELLQGARDRRERSIIISYWDNIPKREVNDLWIAAGVLASEERFFQKGVGLIDASLIVAVRQWDDLLWTLDRKLAKAAGASRLYLSS